MDGYHMLLESAKRIREGLHRESQFVYYGRGTSGAEISHRINPDRQITTRTVYLGRLLLFCDPKIRPGVELPAGIVGLCAVYRVSP